MFQQLVVGGVFSLHSSSAIFLGFTAALWTGWYCWRFILRPLLYPEEPKEYPYWIPFVGHVVRFFKDSEALYTKARLYFGNTREPFTLTVAGTALYIVTSAHDVSLVYRNTVTLSVDEYIRNTLLALGASKELANKVFSSPQDSKDLYGHGTAVDKSPFHQIKNLASQQFLPGPHLADFWPIIASEISKTMTWSGLPHRAIVQEKAGKKHMSVLTWVRETLIEATTTAFFGPRLLGSRPDLVDMFVKFDDESWKMNYQLPPAMCPEFHKNKAEIITAIKQYLELPVGERQGEMWFVRSLEAQMRQLQLPLEDIACLFLMTLWAMNGNAYKSCFWLLAHIFHDPHLYSTIKSEIDSVMSAGQADMAERLDQCPQLVALWHEVLRFYVVVPSIRTIEATTQIGRYKLKKGGRVLIPYHQLHLDENAFGDNIEVFDAGRFLRQKELSNSPSYRPFGGGNAYCSGRIIARWEAFTFVALVLGQFETNLVPELHKDIAVFPSMNEKAPKLGAVHPAAGEDVYIEISSLS